MLRLYSLSYSPWSEKARWALLHHGIEFTEIDYVPVFGELPLRLASRVRGRVSVPLLVTDEGGVVDSCEIARWADAHGAGATLFPDGELDAILRWNAQVDGAISAARAIVVRRIVADPDALREGLPPFFPAWTRKAATPLASFGVHFIRSKWNVALAEPDALGILREHCLQVRAALGSRNETLLDGFTFADIAVAASLQCVLPVADDYLPLGPATRRLWTRAELAAEFADLLAWRDSIYARYRPTASPESVR